MTHLKSEEELEGEIALEEGSDEAVDSKRAAVEDEPVSTEEVMDENCLGRWRRGWSSGNMSSSSASSAVHAQRLIARASFLLDVCASKFRSENKATDLGCLACDGCAVAVRCQFPGNPFSGIVYVIYPPTKLISP